MTVAIEKFFTVNGSSNISVIGAQKFLKNQNDKYHFTDEFISRIGMPYWNKALVFDNVIANREIRTESAETPATVVYIPFVRDSQHYVNASVLVKMTQTDTAYRVILNWQYSEFGFAASDTSWNAQDIFNIFSKLDKSVFGYTKYKIKDGRIFGYAKETELIVTEMPTANQGGVSTEGFQLQCTPHTVCIIVPPSNDGIVTETVCTTSTTCSLVWVDGGGPGPLPPGGGGGGGGSGSGPGGGGPVLPPNPCPSTNRGFGIETDNPCDTTVWVPIITANPCDGVDSLAANLYFRNALTTLSNYTTDTVESGIIFNQDGQGNFTGVSQKRGENSQNPNLDFTVTTLIDGFLHCHLTGNLSIFSPDDIVAIAKLYMGGNIANTSLFTASVVTLQGSQYLLKIEDEVKFAALAAQIISEKGTDKYSSIATFQYGLNANNSIGINEGKFLAFLQEGLGGSGLKLFKGEVNYETWSPIKADANWNVIPNPCD